MAIVAAVAGSLGLVAGGLAVGFGPFDLDADSGKSRCSEARDAEAKFAPNSLIPAEIKAGTAQEIEENRRLRIAARFAARQRSNVILQFPNCFTASNVATSKSMLEVLDQQS